MAKRKKVELNGYGYWVAVVKLSETETGRATIKRLGGRLVGRNGVDTIASRSFGVVEAKLAAIGYKAVK